MSFMEKKTHLFLKNFSVLCSEHTLEILMYDLYTLLHIFTISRKKYCISFHHLYSKFVGRGPLQPPYPPRGWFTTPPPLLATTVAGDLLHAIHGADRRD